jgi:hypothetical protein
MPPTFSPQYIEAVVSGLQEFFPGRSDIFALGKIDDPARDKARYFQVREPLTADVLRAHVTGAKLVGVYPLVADKVKWFAVDIDAPDSDDDAAPDPWERVLAEATRQVDAFQRAGLTVYVERSRSGQGAHVWGFLKDWMPAATVRQAIKPLLVRSDVFDRMYPVQDVATGTKPDGNLIALPFNGAVVHEGKSSFLGVSADAFVGGVERIPCAVLELLAKKAPKLAKPELTSGTRVSVGRSDGRPARPITGVLKLLSPFGCDFMRTVYQQRANPKVVKDPEWYAAIGQLTCFEHGRDAAHILSHGHPQYSPQETDAKYDHALESPPVGCAYIHEHFPKLACKSCPMTAPYHRANRKLIEIAASGEANLRVGGFGTYLPQIWKRDSQEVLSGIPLKMGLLDKYTRFRKAELMVIGAQVSMGKTASAIHMAINVARQGFRVNFFSGEMGQEGLFERFLANIAQVDSRAIMGERDTRLSAAERRAIERAAAELDALPLAFDFVASSPEAMYTAYERRMLQERALLDAPTLTIHDYLQFMGKQIGDDDRRNATSRNVKELKLFTRVTEQAALALSQITRDAEGSDTPSVTWFKESGDIEAEMDVGIIWTGPRIEGRTVPRVATIVKQRRGTANVRGEFLVDQATCTYEPVGHLPSTGRPPLFQPGELGYGESESTE